MITNLQNLVLETTASFLSIYHAFWHKFFFCIFLCTLFGRQTQIVVVLCQVEKQLRLAYKAAEVNYKRSQATQHQNAVNETIYRE